MSWKGMSDSRPEARKPKAGRIDRSASAGSKPRNPTGSEAFGDKVGSKSRNWKGMKDSRPDCR